MRLAPRQDPLAFTEAGMSRLGGHPDFREPELISPAGLGTQERGSMPTSEVMMASRRAARRSTWWTASAGSDS